MALILAALLLGLWIDKRILILMVIVALLTPTLMPSVYHRMAYMMSPEYMVSSEQGGRVGRWDLAVKHWQTNPAGG